MCSFVSGLACACLLEFSRPWCGVVRSLAVYISMSQVYSRSCCTCTGHTKPPAANPNSTLPPKEKRSPSLTYRIISHAHHHPQPRILILPLLPTLPLELPGGGKGGNAQSGGGAGGGPLTSVGILRRLMTVCEISCSLTLCSPGEMSELGGEVYPDPELP